MSAPDVIKDLVKRFDEHRDAYRSGKYNETQLRREFLDPFFEALGWDVFNKQSYAEMYKDVIHEDSLMIELHKHSPRLPQEKESLQREIESTDGRIDCLVYGLNEEEIRVVEES